MEKAKMILNDVVFLRLQGTCLLLTFKIQNDTKRCKMMQISLIFLDCREHVYYSLFLDHKLMIDCRCTLPTLHFSASAAKCIL